MFFFPKTIETVESGYNGTIRVVKLMGSVSIEAGGFTQSGGLVTSIWKSAMSRIKKTNPKRSPRILILGLGAGSAARIAAKLWPESRLLGIEIDPAMISLGETYMHFGKVSNLRVVNADALKWVREKSEAAPAQAFDLILVDLYVGGTLPREVRETEFLSGINALLEKDGAALFNWLIRAGQRDNSNILEQQLAKEFSRVHRIPTPANAVLAAYKRGQ